MQQNQFVLNPAILSSSWASIITFLSSMEAVISDVCSLLKTVIRSRPLPLLAKGLFDDYRCWVFRPIWPFVAVWRDLFCGLMGIALNLTDAIAVMSSSLFGCSFDWVPLWGFNGFSQCPADVEVNGPPKTRQSPFNAHNYIINQT